MDLRTRTTRGFTLVEIAIVLVVIGLLLGGMLRATELLTNARVRELIAQQDSYRTAYYGFTERFRAAPGDYSQAIANIGGVTQNGNGNGRIEGTTTPNETVLAWEHLSHAGFLNRGFTYSAAQSDATSPKGRYGDYHQLVYDGVYGAGSLATPGPLRHNVKTGANVPVEVLAEMDRKIDDGQPNSGSLQFSRYRGMGSEVPTDGATAAPSCTSALDITASWNSTNGSGNCGAASLL